MSMKIKDESQFDGLVDTIEKAGEALLSFWPGRSDQTTVAKPEVVHKQDGSPVSSADLLSNEILSQGLAHFFPDDLLFSEETEIAPERVRASRRTWIIDPLDGTAAFLAGRDDFAILVGLCEEHRPTVGFMYFPARRQFAFAREGRGATLNGQPLCVSDATQARPGSVYIRNFECLRPEIASPPMDSCLAFLKVAKGELDAVIIKMTTHREWDIAAPMVLIREAGGVITDERGLQISCGLGAVSFSYLVASNGKLHQEILRLIPTHE